MLQQLSPAKRILIILLIVICALLAAAMCLFLFLTITEYNPSALEPVSITSSATRTLRPGDSLSILTWNTGYCALGDNSDFFMDGGTQVITATKERLLSNLNGITDQFEAEPADILFLQEVDLDSARSYNINTYAKFAAKLPEYDHAFAANFRVAFLPYPIPPIGKVNSGIATFSRYSLSYADRVQLPCPFTWPVRVANLKRCLLISRIKLEDTDKELVLINLHLEAYDDGTGKTAQTKMLRQYMDAELEKGNYLIVGGDFNQRFSNVDASAYSAYENKWQPGLIDTAEFEDDYTFLMDSTVPSCRSLDTAYAGADPSSFQYYLIDGFILSSNIQLDSLSTRDLSFACSDHNPVYMQVTLLP